VSEGPIVVRPAGRSPDSGGDLQNPAAVSAAFDMRAITALSGHAAYGALARHAGEPGARPLLTAQAAADWQGRLCAGNLPRSSR